MTGSNCSVSPYTVFQRDFLALKGSGAEKSTVSEIESLILANKARELHNIVYSAKVIAMVEHHQNPPFAGFIHYIQAQVVMDRTSNLCRELQVLRTEVSHEINKAPYRVTKAGQN